MTSKPPDSALTARKARLDAVVFAIGSLRLEGRMTSPEFRALQDRFIGGELTEEQCRQALLQLYDESAPGDASHTTE